MNKPLLLKTATYIETHPAEFDMNHWLSACGTVSCIGGTAVWLAGFNILYDGSTTSCYRKSNLSDQTILLYTARTELDIDLRLSTRLFFVSDWPYAWREEYASARTNAARAYIAATYIRWFVKSDGDVYR